MNTVDSLNKFGTAICGESFVSTPGKTDAEIIEHIAKCIKEFGSISGDRRVIMITASEPGSIVGKTLPGLTPKALCEVCFACVGFNAPVEAPRYTFPVGVAPDGDFISIGLLANAGHMIMDYNPATGDIYPRSNS